MSVRHGLFTTSAPQVGVNHTALDGAWSYDGYLNDQIIEASRLESRQHRHLGAALYLEDAHAVCSAQHVVDGGVF